MIPWASEGVLWSLLWLQSCQFHFYNASHICPLFTFPRTTISEPCPLLPGKSQHFSHNFHAYRLIPLTFMLLSAARWIVPNHYPSYVTPKSKRINKEKKRRWEKTKEISLKKNSDADRWGKERKGKGEKAERKVTVHVSVGRQQCSVQVISVWYRLFLKNRTHFYAIGI